MQFVCYFGEDAQGVRGNGQAWLPVERIPAWPTERLPVAGVETIWGDDVGVGVDGLSANRYIFAIVGDGYQSAQLATYATHATQSLNYLFTVEPFKTYASYFTVHRVDVVSADSGVDNDPAQGILRNTALDMAFWCGGTERLLCVSVAKASQAANNAPQPWDQIIALANSTKYGGAGYPSSNLGTSSGGNGSAPEIVVHELGHSMGDLADEYDYGGPATYTGPERPESNVSIFSAPQMQSSQTKWWRWIGVNDAAWDGTVDTYVGGYYSTAGVNRPTFNSKMRALGRPFNLPSAEALILEIYRKVRPIESFSPSNAVTVTGRPTLSVTVLQPLNNPLAIQWTLDGVNIAGATGPTLNLATVSAPTGLRTIGVRVVDNTPWVRDPVGRANRLTQTLSWTWQNAACYADCDTSGSLSPADFTCFLAKYRAGGTAADCDTSGSLSPADFTCFLGKYRVGCP